MNKKFRNNGIFLKIYLFNRILTFKFVFLIFLEKNSYKIIKPLAKEEINRKFMLELRNNSKK
jgi:hypothetical protein